MTLVALIECIFTRRLFCPRLRVDSWSMVNRLVWAFLIKISLAAFFLSPWMPHSWAATIQDPLILVLGDSIAEGYGLQPQNAFPHLLEDLLKKSEFPQARVKNAGISGSTSASALSRLAWHLKSKKIPDVVILELGANDGLRTFPVEETRANLKKALDQILASGATPVLTGMKLPINYGKKYRADFEKVFTELSQIKGVVWMPFLLEGVGGNASLNIEDGIHPNEKGQKIIAKNLVPYVKKAIEASRRNKK